MLYFVFYISIEFGKILCTLLYKFYYYVFYSMFSLLVNISFFLPLGPPKCPRFDKNIKRIEMKRN